MLEVTWPRTARNGWWERAVLATGAAAGWCNVCCRPSLFRGTGDNLREALVCIRCGSFNRQRQMAAVLLDAVGVEGRLAGVDRLPRGVRVWNLEAQRALHAALAARLGGSYLATEYLGDGIAGGEVRNGVMHADLQASHFPDGAFDAVLSSDVLEHLPRPGEAIREMHRVLAPGGHAIFTAPFFEHRFTCEVRAVEDGVHGVRHLLPPVFHSDPIRPEGVLVYNIFGMELLCDLERAGFSPRLCVVRAPHLGIFGRNGLVVHARKR